METQPDQERDSFVSTTDLMEILSVSRSTVYRMVKQGMPHLWVRSVRRFAVNKVLSWLGND